MKMKVLNPEFVQGEFDTFRTLDEGSCIKRESQTDSSVSRVRFGNAIAEVTAAILELQLLPINGSYDLCPDAKGKDGTLYEIKSLQRNSEAVIYKFRLEKELLLEGYRYVFTSHSIKSAKCIKQIWDGIESKGLHLEVVSVGQVARVLAGRPLQQIKMTTTVSGKRNGYQRKGYCEGYYRLKTSQFASCSFAESAGIIDYRGRAIPYTLRHY